MKKGAKTVYAAVAVAVALLALFVVFMYVYADSVDSRNRNYSTVSAAIPLYSSYETTERININTATLKELLSLDDMSRSNAQDIIRYRKEHGKFTSLEELKLLPSFNTAKYNALVDFLSIEDETPTVSLAPEDRVNINTADLRALTALPEISTAIAERIIRYREEYGDFISVRELLEIEGIGESLLRKIEGYITI